MTIYEQQKFYSADDLLKLSFSAEYRDMRLELTEGKLIVVSPAGAEHGGFALRAGAVIRLFVDDHDLGYASAAETGYILFKNPNGKDTVRAPDVGFVAKARLPEVIPKGYMPLAPDLAVEVVSPNDTPDEIAEKVREYLRYGTRMVVVMYPDDRTAAMHTPDGVKTLGEDDIFEGGDVLPGFTVAVRDLFPRKLNVDEQKG
jgi:Uma2 family endonuclease